MKIALPQIKAAKKESFAPLMVIPEILARNAFFICVVLIALTLIVGGIIYLRIDVLIKSKPPDTDVSAGFKQEVYARVLNELNEREIEFQSAAEKIYQNPFSAER